jgi:hypothetical protein
VPGTDRELRCDLVLLAMGFTGAERAGLIEDLGVEIDARGNVGRDSSYATSVPGVFVAGDMGPRAVTDRVGDSRGPVGRGRRRHLPDGGDVTAGPNPANRAPAELRRQLGGANGRLAWCQDAAPTPCPAGVR